MNSQDFKRKLTAVFSADVAGYSRPMGEDEAATIKTLESYKQLMFSLVNQHGGRVVDSPGDNVLAEFPSVVNAVACAVETQKELKSRNDVLPKNRRMEFRIGINLGDVIEKGERIYGDGVNIAARIEALAEGGGICISGTVYDHVKTKLPFDYEFQGEQAVKNIPEPVRVYRLLSVPGAAAHRALQAKVGTKKGWRTICLAASVVLAIEAQATVSACIEAYHATSDMFWVTEARRAFEWFLGRNDLGLALYDPGTGGCRDGLHVDRLIQNQGAESTLAFLLALAEKRALQNALTSFKEPPGE